MGGPLRHPSPDQRLHQAGGVEVATFDRGGHPFPVERAPGHQRRGHAEHRFERVDRVENRLFVFLEVAVVGGRQALQ